MWNASSPLTSLAGPPELPKRLASKSKEPARSRAHWDFVLEEMVWLAKDFERERKWKLSQAKKVALKTSRSKFDNVTKGQKRLKEEEQRIRRLASSIAKDVKKFWTKIEKLVVYKHQLVHEEQKKKALDKHLDFLVGQTERYSTMLAETLADISISKSVTQLSIPSSVPLVKSNDLDASIRIDPKSFEGSNLPSDASLLPSEGFHTPVTKSESEDTVLEASSDIRDTAGISADNEKEDDDAEFHMENDDEMDDDEATLEADEALITVEERKEELLALEMESSLPLEELLKRYRATEDIVDEEGSEKEEEMEADANADIPVSKLDEARISGDNIADAAAAARLAQPTGFTFLTTKVRTKLPFLLKHSLREYQHIGLDWLVTMYEKRLNGILADEMGLGKTIMTISLLAHLACDKGIWGPHLIVVPTSVMLNWEMEFLKWCPAFKILTYFGSAKERRIKRQGWSKANYFHVCITTYRLVIQDAKAFKRKKWKYLILDEAHLIKNWKSQRWQMLLNFNSKRRILLTGTPLQNDLMELWSLMHFLMPHIFHSHQEFRDWFNNPITGMVEGQEQINKELVDRLHNVLRPFILRRLKQDVEKQLPKKYEHVIRCRLSKRQRNLYEDFMASSDTQATLNSGNFLGLINVLMQLRKVCNHPDLFEGRPIISSFDMLGMVLHSSSIVRLALAQGPLSTINLSDWNFTMSQQEFEMSSWEADEILRLHTPSALIEEIGFSGKNTLNKKLCTSPHGKMESIMDDIQKSLREEKMRQKREKAAIFSHLNTIRCSKKPLYGINFRNQLHIEHPVHDIHNIKGDPSRYLDVSSAISDMVLLSSTRFERLLDSLQAFVFAIPAARAPSPVAWCSGPSSANTLPIPSFSEDIKQEASSRLAFLRPVIVRRQLFFPDRRLLQFDCGKLQELATLLRQLRSDGHRALIFTQMTKMLDVLESFVNLHGYTYLRLDGSTKPEERQILMQRFNTNPKFFLFILSTRSGGVGVNLVGADTVIFYDSDWNPAMDQQAQDRCHRIGQTREVHIYRLISESTIEENILKKANQKRALDDLVIQRGSYNTDFFKKLDPLELLSGLKGVNVQPRDASLDMINGVSSVVSTTGPSGVDEISSLEVEAALKNAEDEADYMALKKVEQEEAAERQEFTDEGLPGNIEDDECADDLEEGKFEKKLQTDILPDLPKNELEDPIICDVKELNNIPADFDEDMGVLADVQQLAAAAAAAGRGGASFDDQLQPIERYAMRFLELWDPIIDKAAIANQVVYEEAEWELDQLEKLKEEQEAEIDEDNEPLFYESWDTSFADEAYRNQLELLSQQQMEYLQQLEYETLEEELADVERTEAEASGAFVKKPKKAKFKLLKRGSLSIADEEFLVADREEKDAEWKASDSLLLDLPFRGPSQRKRKVPKLLEEEIHIDSLKKKMRTDSMGDADLDSVRLLLDPLHDNVKKNNQSWKFSLAGAPMKKGSFTIKFQKERKKDGTRSRNVVPPADEWVPIEDAVLCAVVHEYGGNWDLASETLFGIADGVYRGRFRHPIHCMERYRKLLIKHTSILTTGDVNHDKGGSNVAHALLKVTEVHIKQLLDLMMDLPDDELLLQRHFFAVLTCIDLKEEIAAKYQKLQASTKSCTSLHSSSFIALPKVVSNASCIPIPNKNAAVDLVASALAQSDTQPATEVSGSLDSEFSTPTFINSKVQTDEGSNGKVRQEMELSISLTEFLATQEGKDPSIPQDVNVFIYDLEPLKNSHPSSLVPSNSLRRSSRGLSEHRYRLASKMSSGGLVEQWAASSSSVLGIAGPSMCKIQSSRKHGPTFDQAKPSESKQQGLLKGKQRIMNVEKGINNGHTGDIETTGNNNADANVISSDVFSTPTINVDDPAVLMDAPFFMEPSIELFNPFAENASRAFSFNFFEASPDSADAAGCPLFVPDLNISYNQEQHHQALEKPNFDGAVNPLTCSPSGAPVFHGPIRGFDLTDSSLNEDIFTEFPSSTVPKYSNQATAGTSLPTQLPCV